MRITLRPYRRRVTSRCRAPGDSEQESILKALVCRAFGPLDTLRVEDVEARPLGEHDVRIRVAACGINFPDVLLAEGRYQVKPPLPFFPGGEVAGTIAELGSAVRDLETGTRVMTTLFWGGLAEQAIAPANALVAVPEGMDLQTASVFQGGHTTAYYALKQRADLRSGETLLVLGAAGGVGMAAMQIGRAMGARVIGAVGSERKASALRAAGFTEIIDYGSAKLRDALRALVGNAGVDVVLDPVGGEAFAQACRSVRPQARILVVGFASGQIPQFATNLALLKESAVVGVNYQSFFTRDRAGVEQNFAQLLRWYAEGLIRPVIDRVYPLAEAVRALEAVRDRAVIGKVLVAIDS